jgi:hypothetical protein
MTLKIRDRAHLMEALLELVSDVVLRGAMGKEEALVLGSLANADYTALSGETTLSSERGLLYEVGAILCEVAQQAHDDAPHLGPGPQYLPLDHDSEARRIVALVQATDNEDSARLDWLEGEHTDHHSYGGMSGCSAWGVSGEIGATLRETIDEARATPNDTYTFPDSIPSEAS